VVAVVEEMVATVAGAAVVTVPMDLDTDLVVVAHTHPAVVVQQVVVEVEQQRCCSPLWVSI
jgi:hypothetical protein